MFSSARDGIAVCNALEKEMWGKGLVCLVTASVMVGDVHHVFRRVAPTTSLSLFLSLVITKSNTNSFLIQTELLLSLGFHVATSKIKWERASSIWRSRLYLVFLSWRFVLGSDLRKWVQLSTFFSTNATFATPIRCKKIAITMMLTSWHSIPTNAYINAAKHRSFSFSF